MKGGEKEETEEEEECGTAEEDNEGKEQKGHDSLDPESVVEEKGREKDN